ncbi:hypothetical protein [Collinsella aerofaciens]|uniref:hypothetical protein n=2 Tax=Collinsella aerofaciens TaxID=74426 RepID=UPI00232E27D0|nr:hypothetical protein [Collinsella aerofaciens]MDB1912946.1 hypothetical protein [Collinsella aerofaciens]
MGQLPEDAPFKAAHSSRNRARRMKAARTEARRLVGDALRQRDSALAELSSVKDQLTEANRTHERKCAEFKLRTAELAAKAEAASSHEAENLRRVNAETLKSLESERRKTQSLMTRLGELNAQVEGERTEKEEFRQEVLGLRSKIENLSGLSNDEVNGLVARAQAAEERSGELSQNMATLQNQAEDYERQLKEAKDDYERLMRATKEELQKRKRELGEIYDIHEGELETNHGLMKDNAALTDSIAKAKAELETVSAERDGLQKKLADSSARVEELESSLVAEREGACRLRDSEQENAGRLNDLAQEKEALARNLAQTQKARADAVAALKAAQEKNDLVQADLQAAREESYRQRHDLEQKLGDLERGNARIHEQARTAQSKFDESTTEYERKIDELQKALDSKQLELDRAVNDSHKGDFERLKAEVSSERERADRAEGKARAADLLREELTSVRGELEELHGQLADCSTLREDLEDAEAKLADHMARASDAEAKARAAERDSARLSRELERVNMKLAEESSRADGADAALRDADGVRSLALPHGLLPGEETTVALGSGFQKFRVQKIVYRADGTICVENERGQSVPMGTWH